jgi:hypothetical protein
MEEQTVHEGEEKMVLYHEPVPGYRNIFLAAIIVGVIYLGIIFLKTL